MSSILGLIEEFVKVFITGYTPTGSSTAVASVWSQVISFVTSNAIVLIPLVAWLFVLGISSVRKMYKG